MLSNFYEDLNNAKTAELMVRDLFASLTDQYTFDAVGDQREYFYRGDIRATTPSGKEIFIEVKDDSVIHKTGNILCEDEVYYKQYDYYGKGNMQSDYDIYCVVSKPARKIYVLDFKVLKEIYTKGEFKMIDHYDQTTYCYLLPIGRAKQWKALLNTIEF